jgi:phosphoserine aminotransferase
MFFHEDTRDLFCDLMGVPGDYEILYLQGGASFQFTIIPMNLVPENSTASCIVTGGFSKNAYKAVKILGKASLACTTEEEGKFFRLPEPAEIDIDPKSSYCRITSNNSIFGTQWSRYPDTGPTPIVCDMTGDILSRRIEVSSFGLIYAGVQKNLGPAGETVVIISKSLVDRANDGPPDILSYRTEVKKDSMSNTPSCFAVYIMNKVLLGTVLGIHDHKKDKRINFIGGEDSAA